MANTSSITTDFNVYPYYDDYDETKGYYRILFKPGYAVQARELTQTQTMSQKQVYRFAQHIFKDGSLVLEDDENRSKFFLTDIPYVKIRDNDVANNSINVFSYLNTTLRGATSNLTATVIDVLDGVETSSNTKTLYVAYTSGDSTGNVSSFRNNEVLLSSNLNSLTVISSNATGKAKRFKINDGIIFAKEHFVKFPTQTIIAERYSTRANCQIGFLVTEEIVTASTDASLLDPALEASNYQAPGADRLKISASLVRYGFDEQVNDENYFRLISIEDGVVQARNDRTTYSAIMDELARRTYDESGDYYSRGMNVRIRENLDTGNNFGYLSFEDGGDASKLTVVVDSGKAYVQGYEVGRIVPTYLTIDKANTTDFVNGQVVTPSFGNYLMCDEVAGPLIHDNAEVVYLYDTAQNRISDKKWSYIPQTGNIVGTAKLISAYYDSGTLGTPTGQIKVHLFDIKMLGSNTVSRNVKSIYANSGSVIFGADVVLSTSNLAVLEDTGLGSLLYYTGSESTKTLRDEDDNSDTAFLFRKTDDTITGTGAFSVLSTGGENFPYTSGVLSDDLKEELLLTVTSNTSVNLTSLWSGTGVATSNSGNVLRGTGTSFTNLNIGDKLEIAGIDDIYTIVSIANNNYLTVSSNFVSGNIDGNVISKTYRAGDVIDLTVKGATGVERSVTAVSNTQLNFDMKETLTTTSNFTLTYNAVRSGAKEASKTLRTNRYVKINCASAGVTGPFNLGVSDLYKITEIRVHNAPFTTASQGRRVTSSFTINNGQNDYYVDHAKITPRSTRITLTPSDHLLVKLDYFTHDFSTGKGYFSIDSYPINDANTATTEIRTEQMPIFKSSTSGIVYNLRNYLDFRPIKTNTTADATTVAGATENPTDTTTFINDGVGFRLPTQNKQITFDFSYYLGRKDLVQVNKDNKFFVKSGVPSSNPLTPNPVDNAMVLATLDITPYPSLSMDYASYIGRMDLSCSLRRAAFRRYTMRDIGVLKERIDNLEYYANLNALEKDALDMQILDENGLNRFKNGIFVDTFENDTLGATFNTDYRIAIDRTEKSITPLFNHESIYYNIISNNSNIFANTDIGVATLRFTEETLINQKIATTDRNIETSVFNYCGIMSLTPQTDVWVDTTTLPPAVINTYVTETGITQYTGSWTKVVTGYKLIDASTGNVLKRYDPNKQYKIYAAGTGTGANRNETYYNDTLKQPAGSSTNALSFAKFEAFLLAGPDAVKNVAWYSGPNISVRVEEEFKNIREGVSGSSSTEIDNNDIGTFVTDSSLITYMRPQYILFEAKGILPQTSHYVFFDGENMSSFVTPLTYAEYVAEYKRKRADEIEDIQPTTAKEGNTLLSNVSGKLWGALRIPNTTTKRFTNGNKQVIITDSRTNADNPTSSAITNFYSNGLNITTQGLTQSTAITTVYPPLPPQTEDGIIFWDYDKRTTSCIAYSFLVKAPDGEEGVFLTSADVFFSAKDANLGVWFEIKEMDAGGGITRNQVPYSEVWLEPEDVSVSNNSSVPTKVRFQAPVFLKNNQQYAFVIHTVGINPGYRVYVADINAKTLGDPSTTARNLDLLTGQQYTSRPQTGTLYTTNNNLNWDIVDGVDLKIRLYRAKFVTNVDGVITLGNKPFEFFKSNTISGIPFIGEPVKGNDRLTLSGITGGTISTGDILTSTTGNAAVTEILGSLYVMANTGFGAGQTVTARYPSNLVSKGVTASIVSVANSSAIIYRFEDNNPDYRVMLSGSNGLVRANDVYRGVRSGETFDVESIDKMRYSVVNFEPQYLTFATTTINFAMRTVSNTGSVRGFRTIEDKNDWYIGTEEAIYSRTQEISTFSSNASNQVRATLRTRSNYQSPVLDLNRTHSIFIDNIINNNISGEDQASGGELINTYISRMVTLAERQDAEDLNVFLTAYRPPGTQVYVWVKLLNGEDFESFDSKRWIPMEYIGERRDFFSSLSNRNDFIEYGFKLPVSLMTGLDSVGEPGIVQYTTDGGITFTGFKQYAIKVGLAATNSAIVPRVADLRAIALQL